MTLTWHDRKKADVSSAIQFLLSEETFIASTSVKFSPFFSIHSKNFNFAIRSSHSMCSVLAILPGGDRFAVLATEETILTVVSVEGCERASELTRLSGKSRKKIFSEAIGLMKKVLGIKKNEYFCLVPDSENRGVTEIGIIG